MATKSKRSPVTVRGSWFPMPVAFLRSRACAELSPHALKMLMDLCAQLGPNARGNGDLSAAPAILAPRGWASNATRGAAMQELVDQALVVVTRRGDRRRPTLYAVTLWPMDCDFSKLDHGPACYVSTDWERGGKQAVEPNAAAPATWRTTRKNAISPPATGQPPRDMTPQRGNPGTSASSYDPAAGSYPPISAKGVTPPRGTFLDTPSAWDVSGSPPWDPDAGNDAAGQAAESSSTPPARPALTVVGGRS